MPALAGGVVCFIHLPDQFPGYYTLHLRRNGVITGMLSVNGYTGQFWYHNWLGMAILMILFWGLVVWGSLLWCAT